MVKKKKNKSSSILSTMMLFTILLVFLGFGLFALFQLNASGNLSYENQPRIGEPNAPVKLMEFGDFKCPVCKAFHDSIYPQLKKEYIDTGKVQMYFTNYAFIGEDSITAAMVGESVYKQNNDAFWTYYDAVYTHQRNETENWATPEFLLNLVRRYLPNIDANKVQQELNEKTYENDVQADNAIAQSNQVDSVPAIFVNGKMVKDGLNYPELKKIIEEELKKK